MALPSNDLIIFNHQQTAPPEFTPHPLVKPSIDALGAKWPYMYCDSIIDYSRSILFASPMLSIDAMSAKRDCAMVYALHYNKELVYLGSSKNGTRLREHRKKLMAAANIDCSLVQAQLLVCERFGIALMVEESLIDTYKPLWNDTGFGRRPGDDMREGGPNIWGAKYGYHGYTKKDHAASP